MNSFVGFRELIFVDSHELECGKNAFEKSHELVLRKKAMISSNHFVKVDDFDWLRWSLMIILDEMIFYALILHRIKSKMSKILMNFLIEKKESILGCEGKKNY